MNNRQFLIIIGVTLAILAGATVLSSMLANEYKEREAARNYSIYNNGPSGYSAWFQTLQKAGVPVYPWKKSLGELGQLPEPATMVMIAPLSKIRTRAGMISPLNADTVIDLLDWVENGNTLILLDDFSDGGARRLLAQADIPALSLQKSKAPVRTITQSKEDSRAATDELLARMKGHRLEVQSQTEALNPYVSQNLFTQTSLRFAEEEGEILLADAHGEPLLLGFNVGHGHLVLGTPYDMASNQMIHEQTDNFQFLGNLISMDHKPVFLNEYVHGFTEAPDIMAYYRNTPLLRMFSQIILLFVLVLWLSFRLWRPVRREQAYAETVGMKEFVESMAGIYTRAHASSLVFEPQLLRIEQLLRRRYRLELSQESVDEKARIQDLLRSLLSDNSKKSDAYASLRKAQLAVRHQQRMEGPETLTVIQDLTLIEESLSSLKKV